MAYGYTQPKYGTQTAPKMQPFQPSRSLAQAAAGKPTSADPFGLLSSDTTDRAITRNINGGLTQPQTQAPTTQGPVAQAPAAPQTPNSPQAPQATIYDVNVDPALQQVNSYTGLSDSQAQAAADKQRRDALLQYGDQELVKSLYSGDENLAKAAGSNPTSTLNGLKHQRDLGLKSLTDSENAQNLFYSGHRINAESEFGQQFQNALAQAAAGINGTLDQIGGNERSALGQNAFARSQATGEAYNRQLQALLANPPVSDLPGGATDQTVAPAIPDTRNRSPVESNALAQAAYRRALYARERSPGGF